MKVLVCGGREFDDATLLDSVLDNFHKGYRITVLIEGGARGADSLAREWAFKRGVHCATMPALWNTYRKKAGPIRNGHMLLLGPVVVFAFPGGNGTENMVSQARVAGVEVLRVSSENAGAAIQAGWTATPCAGSATSPAAAMRTGRNSHYE